MTEQVLCPVCAWQWDGKRQTCPHCDFPIADFKDFLSGKPVLWDKKLKQEFDDLVAKHRKVYEERKAERLFEGDAFLGVKTSEEAEIIVDGKVVGKTKDQYLALSNLVSGKHLVEARTAYSYGRAEVDLGSKDAKRVEIALKPLKGDLRVLSEVGNVEVEIEGERYSPPVVIRGLSAGWKEVAVYRGKDKFLTDMEVLRRREIIEGKSYIDKFLTDVEVLPGQVVDLLITEEVFSATKEVWVGKYGVSWSIIKNTISGGIRYAVMGAILGAIGGGIVGISEIGGRVRIAEDAVLGAVITAVILAIWGAIWGKSSVVSETAISDAIFGAILGAIWGVIGGAIGGAILGAIGGGIVGAILDAIRNAILGTIGGAIFGVIEGVNFTIYNAINAGRIKVRSSYIRDMILSIGCVSGIFIAGGAGIGAILGTIQGTIRSAIMGTVLGAIWGITFFVAFIAGGSISRRESNRILRAILDGAIFVAIMTAGAAPLLAATVGITIEGAIVAATVGAIVWAIVLIWIKAKGDG
jgi:hypothetical protein